MNDELALAPRDIGEAKALALTLSKASILPSALRGKEADILMTMMAGRELGLGPIASLRLIHIIEGKPSMAAELIAALCLRSPVCEGVDLDESTATKATYTATRKGRKPVTMSFTLDEAKLAGLVGKDNWRKYPAAMLRARCVAALCRAVFPDVVGGLYDPDELERDVTPRPVAVSPQNEAQMLAALQGSIDAVQPKRLLQITAQNDPPATPDYGPDGAPLSERARLEVALEEVSDEASLTVLVERIAKLQPADKAALRRRWGERRDELRATSKASPSVSEAAP
jgi:hypothetical protein